jgi:hypothetical protein
MSAALLGVIVAVVAAALMVDVVDSFGARLEPSHLVSAAGRRRRRAYTYVTSAPSTASADTTHVHHHDCGGELAARRRRRQEDESCPLNEEQRELRGSGSLMDSEDKETDQVNPHSATAGAATTTTTTFSSLLFGPEGSFVFLREEAEKLAKETFSFSTVDHGINCAGDDEDMYTDNNNFNDEECEIPSEWKISMIDHQLRRADDDAEIERDVFAFLGISRAEPIRVPPPQTSSTTTPTPNRMILLQEDERDWQ